MRFNRLKFGFRNKSAIETLQLCESTAKNIAVLPAEFLVQANHEALLDKVTAARVSHNRVASLRMQLKEEISRRNTLLKALREQTTRSANIAAINMNNDPVKMLATGLPLHAEKKPVGLPAAPTNLRAEPTHNEGEAHLRWVRSVRLCSFQIQVQAEPLREDGWKMADPCFKQKCFIKGLASGGKFWFRVRAVNAHGTGAWSNLAPARVK